MLIINYPEPEFRLKKEGSKEFIFDILRKQWLQLTPEEWVRQNFIQYLVKEKKYPASLIAVEKEIQLGELKKRFDILVYNKDHQPWMMIECKAGDARLDENVLEQVLRYNISVPVSYLIITKGNCSFAWEKNGSDLRMIDEIPEWQ
jgi:hypothetical protein